MGVMSQRVPKVLVCIMSFKINSKLLPQVSVWFKMFITYIYTLCSMVISTAIKLYRGDHNLLCICYVVMKNLPEHQSYAITIKVPYMHQCIWIYRNSYSDNDTRWKWRALGSLNDSPLAQKGSTEVPVLRSPPTIYKSFEGALRSGHQCFIFTKRPYTDFFRDVFFTLPIAHWCS